MVTRRLLLGGLGGLAGLQALGCAGGRAVPAASLASSAARAAPEVEPRAEGAGAPPEAPRAPEALQKPDRPARELPPLDLPARPEGAEGGSEFLARTEGLGRVAMDEAIAEAVLLGNVPAYQRKLVPLVIEGPGELRAQLHVLCDYLAVGSDEDFVRMPMTSAAAQRIANRVGASLPTPRIVDAIYRAAEVRLHPCWIDGGPTDGTLADYAFHHRKVEERRARAKAPLGVLTAGHKKDIVLSERLSERDDHVAIYGWHLAEGEVVQPLSMRHSCRYADYSHGVRLVDRGVLIGRELMTIADVLRDPDLAWVLSDEGPLPIVSYATSLPSYEDARSPRKKRKKKRS